MTKESINQGNIKILNVYSPINRASEYMILREQHNLSSEWAKECPKPINR